MAVTSLGWSREVCFWTTEKSRYLMKMDTVDARKPSRRMRWATMQATLKKALSMSLGSEVLREGPFRAVALGFPVLGFHGGVVVAVGVLVQLGGEFLADEPGQLPHAERGQVADGADAVGEEPLFGLLPDPKQVPHAQGPHLFPDLALPEGMDLVRFLEVGGHFRQELVRAHPDIDRKTEFFLDFVLEAGGHFRRVLRPEPVAHVDEALIDGKLLQDRGIAPAYVDEPLRTALVPFPVAADQDQVRDGAERHRHRRGNLDAELFRRNGRRRDDAATVLRIPGDHRGDEPEILAPFHDELHRRPGEEGGVHVDMEDDAGQGQ
jgi:hypothetical protein